MKKAVLREYSRILRSTYGGVSHAVAGTAGIAACLIVAHLSLSNRTLDWWGNISYGYSGIVFAVIVGGMVFSTLLGLCVLLGIGRILIAITAMPFKLRPFHPDGCSGLAPLGRQILWLWSCVLFGVAAMYIALRLGYLGLEYSPITWLLAALGAITAPFVAIVPLVNAGRSLYRARARELAIWETLLDERISQFVIETRGQRTSSANQLASEFNELRGIYSAIRDVSIWPFSARAFASVIAVSLLQGALILAQIRTLLLG